MKESKISKNVLPVSVGLQPSLDAENMKPKIPQNKKRLVSISLLAIAIGIVVSLVAKFLMYIINLITNISFYGTLAGAGNPSNNHLGIWGIFIPAIGGLIVGLMIYYGSIGIRGHGIPEAMEQILTNKSKINPNIVYLKPISSAIAIGTGGPFGAEGPVIATGGALGSAVGQILKITDKERKILLSAGAAAGMAAVFGSPIASIFLAIELLLFEFSPRSLIPIALACITGAAGHHLLFSSQPIFPMRNVAVASNIALLWYSVIGIAIGFLSILSTKLVFWSEDLFKKIPIHFMWYPAIGGLIVGVIGYFAPRTLGVGYYNITDILSGHLTFNLILSLATLKFLSWAIALGSGTSGGTLAPLFTIGGATGLLLGLFINRYFPHAGVALPMAALIGMSAMFAGASRALLTSIIFAIESTGQSNALLPLLAACSASYFISFFFMKTTIMTEKIFRKGVKVPESYEPDALERIKVSQVLTSSFPMLKEDDKIEDAQKKLAETSEDVDYIIITDQNGNYKGFLNWRSLWEADTSTEKLGQLLINTDKTPINDNASLIEAIQIMLEEKEDVLPVISNIDQHFIGLLTNRNVLSAYKILLDQDKEFDPSISLKRKRLKAIAKGHQLYEQWKAHR
jgi:H+/Cl- antiporter ClcA